VHDSDHFPRSLLRSLRATCGRHGLKFLVIAASLGLLAAIVFVSLGRRTACSIRPSVAQLESICVAIDIYRREMGAYPPDNSLPSQCSAAYGMSEALVFYLGQEHQVGSGLRGPYMLFDDNLLTDEDADGFHELRDPWGGLFLYAENLSQNLSPDSSVGVNHGFYDVVSSGPDGLLGGTIHPRTGYVPSSSSERQTLEMDNVRNW
jgi:hypothetical protein